MSTRQPPQFEIRQAFLYGMGGIRGDAERVEEIGIPTSIETAASQFASGLAVRALVERQRASLPSAAVLGAEGGIDHAIVVAHEGLPPAIKDGNEYTR